MRGAKKGHGSTESLSQNNLCLHKRQAMTRIRHQDREGGDSIKPARTVAIGCRKPLQSQPLTRLIVAMICLLRSALTVPR
jgi:hypothetical protein